MATKVGDKNPCPERSTLLGSKDMHGSAGVNQGSNCLEMPCTIIYYTAFIKHPSKHHSAEQKQTNKQTNKPSINANTNKEQNR